MNTYNHHRFSAEIISYAVWLYYRFNLSHRDIEDILAEREFSVRYERYDSGSINSIPSMQGDLTDTIVGMVILSTLMRSLLRSMASSTLYGVLLIKMVK